MLYGLLAATLLSAMVVAAPAGPAAALSGSQFQPGKIISDAQFYNASAMSQSQIQAFLNAKIGTCSNSNCLNVLRTASQSRAKYVSTSTGRLICNAYEGSTSETAAAIIYKTQAACGISARVILVTLQKEQGLVTSRSPSAGVLARAMGYGCPDHTGGTCDANYYGFANQVYRAAWQMKVYRDANFGTYKIGTFRIQYNPETYCGSKLVTIENYATAALYNYTPYTPNAASLSNLYGTAYCGSYGNRNFWVFYNQWFGNPLFETGATAIPAAYDTMGGATGSLGTAVSALVCPDSATTCSQVFRHGVIYWSKATGALVVSGPIGDAYLAAGGVGGSLGVPTTAMVTSSANGGGFAQGFANGLINASSAGAFVETGAIRDAHSAEGSVAGVLGWPTGTVVCNLPGGGCSQSFQGGVVYAPASGGAHAVHEAKIAALYKTLGGPAGSLGYPVSRTATSTASGGGFAQAFQHGLINSSAAGAFTETGAIRAAHTAVGSVAGALGWPKSQAVCNLPDGGCSQTFQGGVIYAPKSRTAQAVTNPAIAALYASLGGPGGSLGYPNTRAVGVWANGGGVAQGFDHGLINAGPSGAFVESGAIRDLRRELGGVASSFGWPVASAVCNLPSGGCSQRLQGGTIYVSGSGVGQVVTNTAIRDRYEALGGPAGKLGYPISWTATSSANGGGHAQAFQHGLINASAAGAFSETGAIRTKHTLLGSVAGSYGWPTAEQVCTLPSGGCSQTFQGGTIRAE